MTLQVVNVYDMDVLKAFLEQEVPRWHALYEPLRQEGDPRWLVLAEQECRLWEMIIALAHRLRRLTVRVWCMVAMLQADDEATQTVGTQMLSDLIGFPFLTVEQWEVLKWRASASRMGLSARDYLQRVVMPQALLLVCASLHVPRRIQLGPHGQGRMLDVDGKWTPQVPTERLGFMMLSLFIVHEVPKAVRCILTDSPYPRPTAKTQVRYAGLSQKFEHQLLGLENRLPSAGPLLGSTPEALAIEQQERSQQLLALERLVHQASPQQREILYGLSLGLTPAQIARDLGVERQTVNKQITRLREKGQSLYPTLALK